VVSRILEAARLHGSDKVMEIGPGSGALTLSLYSMVDHVLAVEKDRDLAERLRMEAKALEAHNIEILCEDILRMDLACLDRFSPGKIIVLGNLPYNISSPILELLTAERRRFSRAVLMFQKEVADRLAAAPGTKAYGALSVLTQYHAKVRILLRVGREAFRPQPKVDSAVVELDFQEPHPKRARDEGLFHSVVRASFAHRRKTLLNTLTARFPQLGRAPVESSLRASGIDPGSRAESLGIDDFISLSSSLPLGKRP
jgi:16S rRNA (adenine1518-N6/adenine1519-N6)-dimethyltransferase